MILPPGEIEFNRAVNVQNLPHRCTILRRTVIDTTPYDEPIYSEYGMASEHVPCRLWNAARQGSGESADERRLLLVYEYRLAIPATTDINEDDAIDNVVNQLGESLHEVPLRITAIWKRTHETVCVLEKMR